MLCRGVVQNSEDGTQEGRCWSIAARGGASLEESLREGSIGTPGIASALLRERHT